MLRGLFVRHHSQQHPLLLGIPVFRADYTPSSGQRTGFWSKRSSRCSEPQPHMLFVIWKQPTVLLVSVRGVGVLRVCGNTLGSPCANPMHHVSRGDDRFGQSNSSIPDDAYANVRTAAVGAGSTCIADINGTLGRDGCGDGVERVFLCVCGGVHAHMDAPATLELPQYSVYNTHE